MNEYALIVGVITLSDIMMTVMGDWVAPIEDEQQIIQRDEFPHGWLKVLHRLKMSNMRSVSKIFLIGIIMKL